MKTTLELPEDLLREAKVVAARRHTTLKAMIEHSLRREIGEACAGNVSELIERNDRGFPVIRRRGEGKTTSSEVYSLLDDDLGRD